MADKKKASKPEKSRPEEKLSDDALKAVTGGAGKKRDLYHGRLTTGTEKSAL